MEKDRDKMLEEYLEICKRTYEEVDRTNSWPWQLDSTNPEDSVDSDSNPKNV